MPGPQTTVAIPTRNGGELLLRTLDALERQTVEHELLVCDSGSTDATVSRVRERGARVLEIAPARFSHGGTRNLLMSEASGRTVAFLTQDAEPADERWLEHLLSGLELAGDVGIAYGPYRPRPDASAGVGVELEQWFASLSPDGGPAVERLSERERAELPASALIGRRGFFTDANACLDRSAWERAPFREVAYAEDRVLAIDMLRAGYAKAFVPAAVVVHSHEYGALAELRRCFDEWRGLREVYGWREPAGPGQLLRRLRGQLGQAREGLAAEGRPPAARTVALASVAARQLIRMLGALLGSHAGSLPAPVRRALSLERRGGFAPLELDDRDRRAPAEVAR